MENCVSLFKAHRKTLGLAPLVLAILIPYAPLRAQGPRISYYYNPLTSLGWAECHIFQMGGSRQAVPFLPVVNAVFYHAPLGTDNYQKDVAVEGLVVFVGNGIVKAGAWDSYAGMDVAGKIVFFCYDFQDEVEKKLGPEFPVGRRIQEAASRKAAGVVLFSAKEPEPFLAVSYAKESEIPGIPAVTITRKSAVDILASSGIGESLLVEWEKSQKPPKSQELISRLSLTIKGKFDAAETKNFLFRYQGDVIPGQQMQELAAADEKALAFLMQVFKEEKDLKWQRLFVVYFRDYDSKLFYTHHWGRGWATGEGVFMVHEGRAPNFPLAVHEIAHILMDVNWGGSTSFLDEGIGKYTEALASDKDRNNREIIGFIKEGKFYRLKDMLGFSIGMTGPKTEVGYPAAGSFVAFLVETYGLKGLKEAYRLEARSDEEKAKADAWQTAFGKSVQALETDWLRWLAAAHKNDAPAIRAYLETISGK